MRVKSVWRRDPLGFTHYDGSQSNHQQPEDKMNFGDAIKSCFSKYVGFEGRATRSEYWWWVLFIVLVSIALGVLKLQMLSGIFSLGILLPSLAVGARRLHDIGKSGWWLLINLVPVVGWLVLLFFAVQPSQAGDNAYGAEPAH